MKTSHILIGVAVIGVLYYLYTKNGGTAASARNQVTNDPGATTQGQGLANNIGDGVSNLLTSGINAAQNLVSNGIQNISSGINGLTETNYTPQQASASTTSY